MSNHDTLMAAFSNLLDGAKTDTPFVRLIELEDATGIEYMSILTWAASEEAKSALAAQGFKFNGRDTIWELDVQ